MPIPLAQAGTDGLWSLSPCFRLLLPSVSSPSSLPAAWPSRGIRDGRLPDLYRKEETDAVLSECGRARVHPAPSRTTDTLIPPPNDPAVHTAPCHISAAAAAPPRVPPPDSPSFLPRASPRSTDSATGVGINSNAILHQPSTTRHRDIPQQGQAEQSVPGRPHRGAAVPSSAINLRSGRGPSERGHAAVSGATRRSASLAHPPSAPTVSWPPSLRGGRRCWPALSSPPGARGPGEAWRDPPARSGGLPPPRDH